MEAKTTLILLLGVLCLNFVNSSTTEPPTQVCKICKQMVEEARETLASNETMDEMRQVFEGTCKILIPIKSVSKVCAKYVDEIVPELVETLYEEMDPTRVCVTSGLCYANDLAALMTVAQNFYAKLVQKIVTNLSENDKETLVKLVEHVSFDDTRITNLLKGLCYVVPEKQHSGECLDAIRLYYPIVKSFVATQFKTGSECSLCKIAVSYLESIVLVPSLEQEVQTTLSSLCSYTSSYDAECKVFVAQYFPSVWSKLIAMLKSENLCADLNLCTSSIDLLPMKKFIVPQQSVKNGDVCTICKDVLTEAKSELLSTEVIDGLKSAIISMCSICPTKDKCVAYLNANFVNAYKKIVNEFDPLIICQSLGVCSDATSVKENLLLKDSSPVMIKVEFPELLQLFRQNLSWSIDQTNEIDCTVCKYLVSFIQEEMNKGDTINKIKATLKSICNKLPGVSAECDDFVDSYTPLIVQLFSHEVTAQNVCYKLTNVCTNGEKKQLPVRPLKNTKCNVCISAVNYMDALMKDKRIDDDFSSRIEDVCDLMPSSSMESCKAIIRTYGSRLVHYIGELDNSNEVCQEVKLCRKRHLLGERKCTFGPSYWCGSMANAVECNAVEHCQTKYWGKA